MIQRIHQRLASSGGGTEPGTSETGASTAEYAIVTMAAVAFAGVLVAILRSDEVRGILFDLVQRALTFGG